MINEVFEKHRKRKHAGQNINQLFAGIIQYVLNNAIYTVLRTSSVSYRNKIRLLCVSTMLMILVAKLDFDTNCADNFQNSTVKLVWSRLKKARLHAFVDDLCAKVKFRRHTVSVERLITLLVLERTRLRKSCCILASPQQQLPALRPSAARTRTHSPAGRLRMLRS